jgi:hypothetical protein
MFWAAALDFPQHCQSINLVDVLVEHPSWHFWSLFWAFLAVYGKLLGR